MQLSHVISDLVLSASATWAWWKLVTPNRPLKILWGAFFIPVALAALFGAARFAGVVSEAAFISKFFQQFASSVGAVGLVCGSWYLTKANVMTGKSTRLEMLGISLGLALLLCGRFKLLPMVFDVSPAIAMLYMLGLGLLYVVRGPSNSTRKIGAGLVSGVIASAAAFAAIARLREPLSIDAYHYLMTAAMFLFGWTAWIPRQRIDSSERG